MNPLQLLKKLVSRAEPAAENSGVLHIAEIPYESGTIKTRYSFLPSPDNTKHIRHGLFVHYHPDGTVASECNYINGLETGTWSDYHQNGQKATEGEYVEGKEHGIWRFWSPEGEEEPSTKFIHGEESA